MSMQMIEPWDIYGIGNQAALLNGVYADNSTGSIVADPNPSGSGKPVYVCNGSGVTGGPRFVLSSTQGTVGHAWRWWMPQLPVNTSGNGAGIGAWSPAFYWLDAGNAEIARMYVQTTGQLVYVIAGGATYTSTSPVVTANAWYHLEVKQNTSGGTFEVRVEGVPVTGLVLTGLTFVNTNLCAQVRNGCASGGATINIYQKDNHTWDGSGSTNNNFLGSVVAGSFNPTSDIALNWTLVGGASGSAALSNVPALDTTQYIQAATPAPSPYSANLSDLPPNVTSIKALMTFVRATKTDGGDGNLQSGIISGAATGLGANRAITSAYTYWRDMFETDPNTSAAWTVAAANAAKLQLNRTV